MQASVSMQCTGGRYPGALFAAVHQPASIVATLQVVNGCVVLRIDDQDHPGRWEELRAPIDRVIALLMQTEQPQSPPRGGNQGSTPMGLLTGIPPVSLDG